MYIKNLKINNFKNITENSFNFSKINLLKGDNGVGKSSTLEALIFLLTNSLTGRLEDYIQWGTKKFSLQTEFLDNSNNLNNYLVEYDKSTKRTLKTSTDEYYQSDASKIMAQMINPNIALYSNVSLQGQSTQLLFEKPTARLEKFKQLFGIDSLNDVVAKMNVDIDECRSNIKVLTSEIALLKDKTFTYFEEEPVEDFGAIEIQLKSLEKEKSKYESEKDLYSCYLMDIKDYNQYIEENKKLDESFESFNLDLFNLEKDNISFKDFNVDERTKELVELKTKVIQIENDKKEIEKLSADKVSNEKKIADLDVQISSISIGRNPLPEKTEDEIKILVNENNIIYEKYTTIKLKYESIQNGLCPTCGAEYSSDNVGEIKLELDLVSNTYFGNKNLIESLNEGLFAYNKKVQENEIKRIELGNLEKQKITFQNSIDEIKIKLESIIVINSSVLQGDIDVLQNLIFEFSTYLDSKKEIEMRLRSISENKKSLVVVKEPDVVVEPEKFNEILFEKIKKDFYILKEKEQNQLKIIEMNKEIKEEEKKNIELITEKEDVYYSNTNKLVMLESSRKLISKDFSSYLIDKGTEFVKNKMNEIFSKSYGKYNISLERDDKGVDFYYSSFKNAIPTTVGLASGYEKQALSVSFRLALASLHSLGIFIFDEIDSDSSEQNSLKLYKTILSQEFSQLFIISHKDETKEYLSTVPNSTVFDF